MQKRVIFVFLILLFISFSLKLNAQAEQQGPRWISDENGSYLLDYNGEKVTGWKTYGGATYYFDLSTGRMTTGSRWIDGELYFFRDGGQLLTTPGWASASGNSYLIGYDGRLRTGWTVYGGSTYFFDEITGVMAVGTVIIDGAPKRFSAGGQYIVTTGWIREKGSYYLADANGDLITGWKTYGGATYYFDPTTGKMSIGPTWVEGKLYFFQAGGQLYNQPGWLKAGATNYLVDYNGSLITGWKERGGSTYYFNPSTGAMTTGVSTVDGNLYYFQSGGQWYKQPGWLKAGTNYYLVNDNGSLTTGWRERGGSRYYFTEAGIMLTGRQTIDGNVYYFKPGGALADAAETYPKATAVLEQVGWDLKSAYLWSTKLDYEASGLPSEGSKGIVYFADYGFTNLYGNCYVYAGTFVEMARVLGYDARQVQGGIQRTNGTIAPHSWVEIDEAGQTYAYDPEFEWQYQRNGFHMVYGQSGTWKYVFDSYMTDDPKQ